MDRLSTALSAIDAANSADPTNIPIDGTETPAELVYGQRMSAMLARVYPDASWRNVGTCRNRRHRPDWQPLW